MPLLPKSEISRLQPSSVVVQPGLCGTWSETPKTGFLTTRLISYMVTEENRFETELSGPPSFFGIFPLLLKEHFSLFSIDSVIANFCLYYIHTMLCP